MRKALPYVRRAVRVDDVRWRKSQAAAYRRRIPLSYFIRDKIDRFLAGEFDDTLGVRK
jgi:hypothetical protein